MEPRGKTKEQHAISHRWCALKLPKCWNHRAPQLQAGGTVEGAQLHKGCRRVSVFGRKEHLIVCHRGSRGRLCRRWWVETPTLGARLCIERPRRKCAVLAVRGHEEHYAVLYHRPCVVNLIARSSCARGEGPLHRANLCQRGAHACNVWEADEEHATGHICTRSVEVVEIVDEMSWDRGVLGAPWILENTVVVL